MSKHHTAPRTAEWVEVRKLVLDMSDRQKAVLFRWAVARTYNAHEPEPCQQQTKVMCREVIADICLTMGLDVDDRALDLKGDEDWQEALVKFSGLTPEQLSNVAYLAATRHSAHDAMTGVERYKYGRKLHRLSMLMSDMRRHIMLRHAGWKPGVGYVDPPKRRRNRRR